MRLDIRRSPRRAQGMTEYIIIVGLIAILLIAAVKAFKGSVQGAFDAGTQKIQSEVTNPINSGN
jgi:Flp pilus assembly pilin Flp